jgi:hypothetical protein
MLVSALQAWRHNQFAALLEDEIEQTIGVKEVDEAVWPVLFRVYDPDYIDLEQPSLQPIDKAFSPGMSLPCLPLL